MNSSDSKISYPHRLLLNVTYKVTLKGSDKCVALSNHSIYLYMNKYKKVIQK